jgi:hypothetical protein
MRKQKPFSKNRILKSTNNNNSSNVANNNTMVALTGKLLENDYDSSFVRKDRLADGLNSITKSILQQKGVGNQLEQRGDNIPLRPLLLNGSQNQENLESYQSQKNE